MILRMVRKLAFASGLMSLVLSGGTAYATIIWDYSPETTRAAIVPSISVNYSNQAVEANYAETVSFASGATVTGIDIYSGPLEIVDPLFATVRLWSDVGGRPGALLENILTSITIIDTDGAISGLLRKHAEIDPLLLSAGTRYWIGMSGGNGINIGEIGQVGLDKVDDGKMAVFGGTDTSFGVLNFGDMAFRLEGSINAVPEPGTFILLGAGLGGLVLCRRRQRC